MGKVLPILFNGDMVRAILDGRKTVTRRICRDGNRYTVPDMGLYDAEKRTYAVHRYMDEEHECESRLGTAERPCPICPGDILYVRETWAEWTDGYVYKTWISPFPQPGCYPTTTWHPSIHMPKQAARIWLKVTDVRVERLQKITIGGCEEEGCWCDHNGDIFAFMALWDSTVKKADIDRYGWGANPWVWVIEFERCGKPEEEKRD